MKDAKRRVAGLMATLVLAACWGCGGGASSVTSSSEEAAVKGIITIEGKPATRGRIQFDPSIINRGNGKIVTAPIQKDGSYAIKTVVGDNLIQIKVPQVFKDRGLLNYQQFVNVQSGQNTISIDVK
jgi:hypothetical protein